MCGDWPSDFKTYNLTASMGSRSNWEDNAVAGNFLSLLKPQRIRQRINRNGAEGKGDESDQIELSSDPKRRNSHNGNLPLMDHERDCFKEFAGV